MPRASRLEQGSGREVSLGSVYATLGRLETKGLLVSELGEPTAARGGRAKAYFHLSPKGVREVRDAHDTLTRLWQGLPELQRGRG